METGANGEVGQVVVNLVLAGIGPVHEHAMTLQLKMGVLTVIVTILTLKH